MSKYGIVIIITLIVVTIGFSAWQVMSGNTLENQFQTTFLSGENEDKLGAKFPDEGVDQTSMRLGITKGEYLSEELAEYSVKIKNAKDANNLMLEINGLTNSYGTDYIREKKLISLTKDEEQTINFSKKLPVCNTCSGFVEDDYFIEAKLYRGDFLLASDKITFKFADKEK